MIVAQRVDPSGGVLADGAVRTSVQFFLFGPVEVRTPTRSMGVADFPSRKAKQVCELLVCAAGASLSKDQLIDAVWGDKLPGNPSAAIDHTISLLRATLIGDDGSQPIVTERGRYRIDLTVAEIDLVRFDDLVDRSSAESRIAQLPKLLEAAALARGTVLEDELYAPWAEQYRDRYRRRVERVLLDLARSALVHDDPQLALEMAERAREESALVLEEGYALCISALIRLGRRHDARSLMLELERRMSAELDADIAPETMMLRSILRNSGASTAPATVAVAARLTEPIDTVPFVGRSTELAQIDDAIARARAGANQLLVIQGPSGIGKSALLAAVRFDRDVTVRTFACLPSDAEHPLYVVHRLMRSLAVEAGIAPSLMPCETVSQVFERLADTLDRLGPTVVTIDDLQWADAASLAVIVGLARPHEVRSLLVIATRKIDESTERGLLRKALGRHEVIELGPLPKSVVDELPIESGWDESGGHPGLLVACVEATRIGGRLSAAAIADVLAWVGPDGSAARTALEAAAATGPSFDTIDLAGQLGLSPTTTRELLADAQDRHLVRVVDPAADLYEFQADLTRRVLRETFGSRRTLA